MAERPLLGGTDGLRGVAFEPGVLPIDEDTFAGATYALVAHQQEAGVQGPVVVAQDTRPSGYRLRQAVIDGALARGAEVVDLGIAPTPAAQKIAEKLGASVTAVVSASHNPVEDNGWKGMLGANKPVKEEVRAFSERYWRQVDNGLVIPRNSVQPVAKRPELLDWYADAVVADIEAAYGQSPLAGKLLVVDGAYGAAHKLAPTVLRRLGADVETFACDRTGVINEGCGAADLTGLRAFLASRPDITSNPAFLGAVAKDGDADRSMAMGVVFDKDGSPEFVDITGNHIMWALAEGQPGMVGTDYTNSGLTRRLERDGIGFEYCRNGDVFVTQALRAKQAAGEKWTRGGEFSGHLVDTEWLSSGDGVRMAAWFAAWAARRNATFADIHRELPLWHEKMAGVKLADPEQATVLDTPQVQDAIRAAEYALGDNGRMLVRPSGTEPKIRAWSESREAGLAEVAVSAVTEAIKAAIRR